MRCCWTCEANAATPIQLTKMRTIVALVMICLRCGSIASVRRIGRSRVPCSGSSFSVVMASPLDNRQRDLPPALVDCQGEVRGAGGKVAGGCGDGRAGGGAGGR